MIDLCSLGNLIMIVIVTINIVSNFIDLICLVANILPIKKFRIKISILSINLVILAKLFLSFFLLIIFETFDVA